MSYKSTKFSVREVTDANYAPVLQSNRYHHYVANNSERLKSIRGKMSDEKPVSSNTKTETKIVENADGSTTKTITTTITDKFADGSTSTKTKVQTITEGIKPSGESNVTSYKGLDDIKAQQQKAEKVKVTSSDDFLKDALKAHNDYRKKHGVKSLDLDKELCKVAQAWVNQLAKQDKMAHSSNGYGENVFWTSAPTVTAAKAVDSWYNEIKDFNWSKVDHQPGTGHFTQVVWKNSEKLGIAYASTSSGTYVVANYDPAGNFIGDYASNVMPLKK